jgi:hypothetical protein
MHPRPSIVVAVASGLAGIALGLMLGRPSTAQAPVAPVVHPQPQVGRYQVSFGGSAPYAVVVDTATGRCWSHFASTAGGPWQNIGTPVK